MDFAIDPRSLLRLLWRRRWFLMLPVGVILGAAIALMYALPPMYRSEATILVENKNVPDDLVPSLFTDYVDRRLATLTRRVLVNQNLLEVADRYELYPEEREVLTRSQLARRVRDHIGTETVSTEVTDPDSGRSSQATIAFQIRFSDRDPQTAQRVANELVSLYIAQNLEERRRVASETTTFFGNQRSRVDERIQELEDRLATFKTENYELLPAQATFRRQQLADVEQQLQSLERERQTLGERAAFLRTQLSLTDEFDPTAAGATTASPEAQAEMVRAELARARARYNPDHPDVLRLGRELRSLEALVGDRSSTATLVDEEARLASELATLSERYTDEHPDVRRAERQLASVRAAIDEAGGAEAMRSTAGRVRNSAYVQLSAQLNSVESELEAVADQRAELREQRARLREELAQAPAVEREYERLTRLLESAVTERTTLAEKESSAELSRSLEGEGISERLTLIEPPTAPNAPTSPNKKLILAAGLVLSLGAGAASVALAELFDRSVRSAADLGRILGDSPLAQIPEIVSPGQRRRTWAIRGIVGAGLVVVIVGVGWWFDHAVMPLDVAIYQLRTLADGWLTTTFPGLDGGPVSGG
jgi:uncharacterized protein involved in exopolysaccharide biosynthesis